MTRRFDYFVVFAEMRTGSNFLESNINALDGLICNGEAFNPSFVGYPNKDDLYGIDLSARDADPLALVRAIANDPNGLGGFRFFNDHDPRVLTHCLDDPRCGKIILTRNPADSYVSLKIARATGQWKLTNVKRRREAQIDFDLGEFAQHIDKITKFQQCLLRSLQTTGQSAFYLAYEDLHDLDVINGLGRFLGATGPLRKLDSTLKPQNPVPLKSKVRNFDDMQQALAEIDTFDLTRIPNLEPRRGPNATGYVAAHTAPLLYMPIMSTIGDQVKTWLADLDGVPDDKLCTNMNQGQILGWKKSVGFHRSFTVLRHPAARLHDVFCKKILNQGPGGFSDIRQRLRNFHKVPIPGQLDPDSYDLAAHSNAFCAFIEIIGANLNGQTGFRVDPHWATQSSVINGMARFSLPDRILREDELQCGLGELAAEVGYKSAPDVPPTTPDTPYTLSQIYDDTVEDLIASVYRRDYLMFGFGPWSAA